MKTFEEKLTAWLDDRLTGAELAAFERELESHPEALAETESDRRLGDLLRANLPARPLNNPDFFNLQILEQIEASQPAPAAAVRSLSFWTLPRMAFSGTFLLLLATILYFAAVPNTRREVRQNQKYVENVLNAHSDDPDITATSFHSKQDNVNVLWLDGLNYMPPDHKLKYPSMPLLSLLAFGLICWLSGAAAQAAEPSPPPTRIWSGLVLATNGPHPGQPPEHLRNVAGKLKNIFGYNQFEIVGEYSEKMDDPNESWLIPSKDFYLSVKSHTAPGGNYPMKIVLFQNRRRLAELEAHVAPDSPLFIKGPLYARGQLVIVLRVADPSEYPPREIKPPTLTVNPTPTFIGSPPKEKEHSMLPPPPPIVTAPAEKPNPLPADHIGGPIPPDRPTDLGPGPKLSKP